MRSHKLHGLLVISVCILFTFCAKKTDGNNFDISLSYKENNNTAETPQWYYFTQDGNILPVENPALIPAREFVPWTEAVRVSGLSLICEPPIFLINKTGLLFPCKSIIADKQSSEPYILKDTMFLKKTADGFYKTDLGQLIRLYTNTIFSSVDSSDEELLLCRYNSVNNNFIPVISFKNFNLEPEAQLVNLEYKEKWFASFKTEKYERVSFDYFSFKNFSELLKGNYVKITQDEFIKNTAPIELNTSVPKNTDLYEISALIINSGYKNIRADFFSPDLKSKSVLSYIAKNSESDTENSEITACACKCNFSHTLYAVLFNTGTLSVFNEKEKNVQHFKLPKLPKNTVYTYFILYDNILTAAWEEQVFFEVGRSGLYIQKLF